VRLLAVVKLRGLAPYGEAFGATAADSLLARVARRIAGSVGSRGKAYRVGAAELCVLIDGSGGKADEALAAVSSALTELDDVTEVSGALSVVTMPFEANDAATALHLAEERIHVATGAHRSAAREAEVQLIRALRDRHPELAGRVSAVPELARAVGRRLGIGLAELQLLSHAAELHDIGKQLIPDEIRNKSGDLSEREWATVREHSGVAERLIATEPALEPVSRIVRSIHERWDGDGYPDGLRGTEIPLPSRIILACEAFEAMTSPRPYRDAMSGDAALFELRRSAGAQLDPIVVDALAVVIRQQSARFADHEDSVEAEPPSQGAARSQSSRA
jgi:two-component system cell cycle response regulator